jgi:hypothetical protein
LASNGQIKVGDNPFEVDLRGWVCPFPKYAVEVLAPGRWRIAIRT